MRYYLYQNCCEFSFKNVLFKNFFEKNSKKYCHFIVTLKKKKPTNPLFMGECESFSVNLIFKYN